MKIIHFDIVNSTNDFLKQNYSNLDDFTFVSTSYQSSGRGRNNRKWYSSKNDNLLFSYLIKDKDVLKKYKALSIGSATLIARFLELEGIKNVSVKWPNDVYVNNKKICGILLEGQLPNFVVIGIGLNVNQTNFNNEYKVEPTSMKLETNILYSLNELEGKLFAFLKKHIIQKNFESNTFNFLTNHNYLFGKKVVINKVNGIVDGIDSNFNILINGQSFDYGEVEIVK